MAGTGVSHLILIIPRALGRTPFLAAPKMILETAMMAPLREPAADTPTDKGMIHEAWGRVTSANVYNGLIIVGKIIKPSL